MRWLILISYLQIENFKSLKKVALPLKNLNLLLGMNGAGKSSIIQALLLLRQSYWTNNQTNLSRLFLNGELISLGTAKDIFSTNAEKNYIRFYVKDTDQCINDFKYRYIEERPLEDILQRNGDTPENYDACLFLQEFKYLAAEHLAPQKKYSLENWNQEMPNMLGNNGQNIVPFLATYGEKIKIDRALCLETAKSDKLIDQVSAWMNYISPGVQVRTTLNHVEQEAKLLFNFEGKRLTSEPYLPVNVGFGLPYVLPLIVELLIAEKGTLVLLENPESHLHPKGQSMMANLIAKVAARGVQIICESHSDHIINGIRVATKNKEINNDDIVVSYFEKDESQDTKVINIKIDGNGNLNKYPKGLLDEWGELMAKLL